MSDKSKKKTSIGGQAVLEGVMMRGASSMATAVRDEDGIIRIESKRIKSADKRNALFKLPIFRGIYAFIQSFVGGISVLMRSAEVYGEAEPSKFEKWLSKKFKIDIMSVIITLSLILGIGFALLLFVIAPIFLRKLIEFFISGDVEYLSLSNNVSNLNIWAKNFIEGGVKILIFVLYILFCSLIKDVRRTFMYHGAEHKTISCFESGMPLTVENAKKCTRVHNRCGTTFIVFVMVISILSFTCLEALIGNSIEGILRVLCKIAILPIVAGLSYELLKGLAKTDSFWFMPLKVPGLLLQRLTTKEPDDKMLEVAICAFNTVLEMDADPSISEKTFITSKKACEIVEEVRKKLMESGIDERAESEWIVSISANIKRDEVYSEKYVKPLYIEKINKITEERCTGRPLWYCIGDTDFYGYKINVDERVLIPRPETELLVEEAKKVIKPDSKILDLCTGSGAIAIAVAKECGIGVTACDISVDALEVAKENAKINNANIDFIESDLFDNLTDRKFDVIISNPPYIKSSDMDSLQKEVKDFEPSLALDGGKDGLIFYEKIAKNCQKYLNEGGIVLLECGINQAGEIMKMFEKISSKVEIIKDLENIDRIVKAVF